MPPIPGFIGPSYVSTAVNVAAQTLFNWYPESIEVEGEPARVVYYPTPGLSVYQSLGGTPIRALFAQDGRCFAVAGQSLVEMFDGSAPTGRGTLSALDTSPATITSNGTAGHQLFITSGGKADIFDLNTNTLTPITAAGYPASTAMGTYLDTYFLTTKGSSAQFNISANLDGTSWSTLDFAVRTEQSDNLVGIIQNNKVIWLIGSHTSEPWYDSGAASFPFEAVPQVIVPIGCQAPFSIAKLDTNEGTGVTVWLSQTSRGGGKFVGTQGYAPQRLSTFAVESEWAKYPKLSDAVSYCYSDQGHDFCVLTFPSGNATWVYDFTQRMWHRRSWWNPTTANQDRHRGWVHCFAFGKHLVGDWQTGVVYLQDVSLTTDIGADIIRERQSPHANASLQVLFFSEFQLDFETGRGNPNAPGNAPNVRLAWSDDGGHTFGSEIAIDAGITGDYTTRCRAAGGLGSGRNRVWRVRATDPIPYRGLMQAYVNVVQGTS